MKFYKIEEEEEDEDESGNATRMILQRSNNHMLKNEPFVLVFRFDTAENGLSELET